MSLGLEGDVVVITGASSGIGAASAIRLSDVGAKVALVGRDEGRLQELEHLIRERDGLARSISMDLSIEGSGDSLVAEVHDLLGNIDVLVHCAGLYRRGPLSEASLEDFDLQWRINTRFPYALTQAALPDLTPGGRVIFVTSKAGRAGLPDRAAYGATKAATEMQMRALANELAPQDVRVNAVAPGFIATPMNEALRSDQSMVDYIESITPAGRLGRPEEVAAAVLWLASSESEFVYGQSIGVDGGYPTPPNGPNPSGA
jgi:NAD(P)-dependent dehydrogenase (short-subunit alcohol dehydrogenase family)